MEDRSLLQALRRIADYTLGKCAYDLSPGGPLGRAGRVRVPSGDMKYGAFWVRDAAMMAQAGLTSADELKDWIELISLQGQNDGTMRKLKHGLSIPPWCVCDHVNFDGGAVFYPGTMSSSDDQGNGAFGFFPPLDESYYFIGMVYQYWLQAGERALEFLCAPIGGQSPLTRAWLAFESGGTDGATGLCRSDLPRYTVDWGFCDTVIKSGLLLFPSLLRYEAALRLAALTRALGLPGATGYERTALCIADALAAFSSPSGWLLSATETCRQEDVWGTAFAVWCGVLQGEALDEALGALTGSYLSGAVTSCGYIRHVPLGHDAAPDSAWENVGGEPGHRRIPRGIYQNGAFWSTPTGWYAWALHLADPELGQKLLSEFAEYTLTGLEWGAPYEWRKPDDSEVSGLYYGASAALPYSAAARIEGEVFNG